MQAKKYSFRSDLPKNLPSKVQLNIRSRNSSVHPRSAQPQDVPATDGGLRGVGGGGLAGLGGRAGLQVPFVSNGESLPLTVLFSLEAASSQFSRPFELVLLQEETQRSVVVVHGDMKLCKSQNHGGVWVRTGLKDQLVPAPFH